MNPDNFITLGILVVAMMACVIGCNRLGKRLALTDNYSSQHINHIELMQGSLLGLLALVMGFTFSLALSRYDSRSEAVSVEANTMVDVVALAELLPAEFRQPVAEITRQYIRLRIEAGQYLVDDPVRLSLLDETRKVQLELWKLAYDAADVTDSAVKAGLFINALNEMLDARAAREAQLHRQVPPPVLWLLFLTFLFTASVIGYTAGLSRHAPSSAAAAFLLLIVGLMGVIIDLDHPRDGLIKIDQSSLQQVGQELGIE